MVTDICVVVAAGSFRSLCILLSECISKSILIFMLMLICTVIFMLMSEMCLCVCVQDISKICVSRIPQGQLKRFRQVALARQRCTPMPQDSSCELAWTHEALPEPVDCKPVCDRHPSFQRLLPPRIRQTALRQPVREAGTHCLKSHVQAPAGARLALPPCQWLNWPLCIQGRN